MNWSLFHPMYTYTEQAWKEKRQSESIHCVKGKVLSELFHIPFRAPLVTFELCVFFHVIIRKGAQEFSEAERSENW